MKLKLLYLLILVLGFGLRLHAHAIWIKTDIHATRGDSHAIEIVWAEDGKNEQMPVDKWFSDLKDFTLYVIDPNGTQQQIPVTAGENSYTAHFTPDKDGIYIIGIAPHIAKNLGGSTKLEYAAVAMVKVGKTKLSMIPAINDELTITGNFENIYKKGKNITLNYIYKKAPKEKIEVEVFAPNGWHKTFETDTNGKIDFPLLWCGNYTIEAVYIDSEDSGNLNNKPYKSTRHCQTYCFLSK